ncbi:MAG: hypothetical protein WCF95_07600 [bacterium]
MKRILKFLTQNDEPVGLKALNLEAKKLTNTPVEKNVWETPLFVRYGEFYKSLKKIEEKY